MGTYTRVYNFLNGSTAYGNEVASEMDSLGSSVNNIVNAQISSGAAIADSKLAQISTASKVALSGLVQGGTGETLLSGGGTAAWGVLTGSYMPAGSVVQVVNYQTGAYATAVNPIIPNDDTLPQVSEGAQFLTLAITPTSATNALFILAQMDFTTDSTYIGCVALFSSAGNDALKATQHAISGNTLFPVISLAHYMVAGTTSTLTFTVRAGQTGNNNFYLNGYSGARKLGGAKISSITIAEIKV
jgi:hypothetical protein